MHQKANRKIVQARRSRTSSEQKVRVREKGDWTPRLPSGGGRHGMHRKAQRFGFGLESHGIGGPAVRILSRVPGSVDSAFIPAQTAPNSSSLQHLPQVGTERRQALRP